MKHRAFLRSSLPVLLLCAQPLAAQDASGSHDWPNWRGPHQDGVAREATWSSVGAVEPLWRAEVGLGYSTVTVAGGRLYTVGHTPSDAEDARGSVDAEGTGEAGELAPRTGTDTVVCLDANTGEQRWAHAFPADTMALYHGGGSLSTPVVAGDVVYHTVRDGRFLALDAETGALEWERDYADELGIERPMYGFAASPVVLDGAVIVALGTAVIAVDPGASEAGGELGRPGDVLWKHTGEAAAGYATPIAFVHDGRALLGCMSGRAFLALDADTGEVVYRHPWTGATGSVNAATPIVDGDRVFLSSAYDAGAALLRLRDAVEPEVLWTTRRMRNKVSGCTLWQGDVYGFDESMLKCISFEDGSVRWSVRGLGMGSVAVAGDPADEGGGRLLVLTSRGELIVAEASPDEFRELSRRQVLEGGVYWTTPVLVDGLVYCRNSLGGLVCLDHRSDHAGRVASPTPARPGHAREEWPNAVALVAKHAARIGGERLETHTSLTLTGTYESTGAGIVETAMVLHAASPDRWHLAWDLEEYGWASRAFDGEVAWQLDPFYGEFVMEEDARREVADTVRLRAAIEWDVVYANLETVGRERFAGRDCWVVRGEARSGAVRSLFFDVDTGLHVGRRPALPDAAADSAGAVDTSGEAMVVFEDYRDFEGVLLPTRISYLMPDTGAEETLRIEGATWDAVDPSVFERPLAVRKLLRTPEEVAADAARLTERFADLLGAYERETGAGELVTFTLAVEAGDLVLSQGNDTFLLDPTDEADPAASEEAIPLRSFPARLVVRRDEEGACNALVLHGFSEEPLELTRVR